LRKKKKEKKENRGKTLKISTYQSQMMKSEQF